MTDPDCIPALYPCWQHYGEHFTKQPPVAWVLDLAESLVRFRARTLPTRPTYDEMERLQTAVRSHQELLNERWRNITRYPFPFDVGEGYDTEVKEDKEETGKALLKKLGLYKPPEPMNRKGL